MFLQLAQKKTLIAQFRSFDGVSGHTGPAHVAAYFWKKHLYIFYIILLCLLPIFFSIPPIKRNCLLFLYLAYFFSRCCGSLTHPDHGGSRAAEGEVWPGRQHNTSEV
jgi:hypothetical protein